MNVSTHTMDTTYIYIYVDGNIMGRMAFILRRWQPHARRGLLPIIMLPEGGFLFALHLCADFEF